MKFEKGKSGNPSGRPKLPEEFLDLARKASVPALKRAIALIDDQDGSIALKAVELVVSRAWGKPAQSVDVTHHKSPFDGLDAGTIKEVVEALRARVQDAAGTDGAASIH